jgi:hypothetical protein
MKNVKVAISIAMAGLLLGACWGENQDWRAAETRNAVEGYREFLGRYPRSERAAEARRRIEDLDFERAKQVGTVDGWQSFLDEHPHGARAAEAQDHMQERAFADATAAHSVQAYQDFVRRYPNGKRAQEVSAKLEDVFPPIPRDKVLVIPGIAPYSGIGKAIVRNGDTAGLCEIISDGRLSSKKEIACLDLCYGNIELRANTRVPVVWFKGKGPVNRVVSHNFRVRMNGSCGLEDDPGAKPLHDEMGFLVSGPQGAKLKKSKNGFQLVEGQANYLKPGTGLLLRSKQR